MRERADPLIINRCPLDVPVKEPKATRVQPLIRAEVEYGGVTEDGLLRAAVFKGLRDDLSEPSPAAPSPQAPSKALARTIRGVPRENILQLLPDAVVPSEEELVRYWTRVAKQALTYLGRRPLKLVRNVHGTVFYHKGPAA